MAAKFRDVFSRAATKTTLFAGSHWAFLGAVASIVVWLGCGPAMHWDMNFQLIANTGTTLITYLMVFLIQHTQNRESQIVQLKLDEIIRSIEAADNDVIAIEDLTEEKLKALTDKYRKISNVAKKPS